MILNRPASLYIAAFGAVLNVVVAVVGVDLSAEALAALNGAFAAVIAVVVGVQVNSARTVAQMNDRLVRGR